LGTATVNRGVSSAGCTARPPDIGDTIRLAGITGALKASREIHVEAEGSTEPIRLRHTLSERQIRERRENPDCLQLSEPFFVA